MGTCALEHLGKWALVYDGELVGVFDGFEGAPYNSEIRERAVPYSENWRRPHDAACIGALQAHVCLRCNADF